MTVLVHVIFLIGSFYVSFKILEKKPRIKGQVSSLAAALYLIGTLALCHILRMPILFVETTARGNQRGEFAYLGGGIIFAAHFAYLTFRKKR